jgi:hypothetical protein
MSLDFADRFKKPSFSLAPTGGEGIRAAASLSTLPGAYAQIRENSTDWGDYTASMLEIEGEKARRLEIIDAQTEATENQIAAYDSASDNIDSAQDDAENKGMWGNFLNAAAMAAPLLISSDETMKNTVEELEDACALLRQLRPVSFFYNAEYTAHPEKMHYGFIAQEYQKVMPDHTYHDPSIDKLCIDTGELIAVLVKANQQLQDRVSRLESSFSVLGDK